MYLFFLFFFLFYFIKTCVWFAKRKAKLENMWPITALVASSSCQQEVQYNRTQKLDYKIESVNQKVLSFVKPKAEDNISLPWF